PGSNHAGGRGRSPVGALGLVRDGGGDGRPPPDLPGRRGPHRRVVLSPRRDRRGRGAGTGRRGDRPCGGRRQPSRRSAFGAPPPPGPRDPPPVGPRPRGRCRPGRDVGEAGAVHGGAGPVTGGDWFQLFVIALLIAAVGVLGASEVSITRVNRVRAYRFAEEKRRGSGSLAKIADNPASYLNVVLLLTLLATIGGTTIATSFAVRHFHGAGEIVATIAMTILLFVFAEVTPKTFAIQQTDRVALVLAPLIVALGRLVGPLASGLVKLANVIMPGKGLPQGPFITENEIRALAEVASDEEQIEEEEK